MSTAPVDAARQIPPVLATPPESERLFQGIPGIQWVDENELYATWYAGGPDEGPENYVVVTRSHDDGETWASPHLFVAPEGNIRAFDPVLWLDPQDRLWLFWAQSEELWDGRGGVWASHTETPAAQEPVWTAPRWLCDGVMMNKPALATDGTWMLPVSQWQHGPNPERNAHPRLPSLVISRDNGETFEWLGGADLPDRSFDEHHVIELKDGRLGMYARSKKQIATTSFSSDGGHTWSPGELSAIPAPDSRFYLGKLHSGRWLLISHAPQPETGDAAMWRGRSHLTAWLSDDEGATWQGGLLLDERHPVSYPDACQAPDGTIWVIYDYNRKVDREILTARFREEDILAGKMISPAGQLRIKVAGPVDSVG